MCQGHFPFTQWPHRCNESLGKQSVECVPILGRYAMKQQMSCRDMELLYRQRAVFDSEHSWKWLGEAERCVHLAQKETASRFKEIGPMAMGLILLRIDGHL